MCSPTFGDAFKQAIRAPHNPVKSSGGYEGGGSVAAKSMGLGKRRRQSRLPVVPVLGAVDEEGAV